MIDLVTEQELYDSISRLVRQQEAERSGRLKVNFPDNFHIYFRETTYYSRKPRISKWILNEEKRYQMTLYYQSREVLYGSKFQQLTIRQLARKIILIQGPLPIVLEKTQQTNKSRFVGKVRKKLMKMIRIEEENDLAKYS